MPTYKFKNTETDEEFIQFMGISEADTFLENNPHIKKMVHGAPMLHSGRGIGGGLKIDNGFNDVLKEVKKHHNGGYKLGRSTINTK
jgi:hypothetical protein